MNQECFEPGILELIRLTSSSLPPDVEDVILSKQKLEKKDSIAAFALNLVATNLRLARSDSLPICQDTGLLTFFINHPAVFDARKLIGAINSAVSNATSKGYLRQNSVDSLRGENSGNNLGPGSPVIHTNAWDKENIEIKLVQKGGGCENMSRQYSLPDLIQGTNAGRDLAGVRACILDAIHKTQGMGCGPGFLGVSIGGDRALGFENAKMQFLRYVDDVNPDPELAALEADILDKANRLDIGPMGFGGAMTIGACKIGALNRLPASFFVTIAYMCWAFRRRGVVLSTDGAVLEWLYQKPYEFDVPFVHSDRGTNGTAEARSVSLPMNETVARSLKVGDVVLLDGTMFTGRDAVHKYLAQGGSLDVLHGGSIYHCGPVMLKTAAGYRTVAAGPTTSIREEPYQATIIDKFKVRAIIGKGGMGRATLDACKSTGAVYFHAIGGAAQVYARCVKRVVNVYLLKEFGSPEAVWELEVEGFPVVVTMDANGNSLHEDIESRSLINLKSLSGL